MLREASKSITLHPLLMVLRLRTIPIPTIQVLVGTGLAYAVLGRIDWIAAFFTLLVAILITFGTNVINDVFDFEKGGDPLKRNGHLKVIRAGLLSKQQVYALGMGLFGLAIVCSIPLAMQAGWFFLFLVVFSACLGYCYTGGPYPICYLGLSELFILVFYGGVCVISAYYVQTHEIDAKALLCSFQMGGLAIIPNALNNFRDMFEDAMVNKRTLAVRFGKTFARWEITLLIILPFLLCFIWIYLGYIAAALLPLLIIPLAVLFIRSIFKTDPSPIFNRYFGLSVLIHFMFGILLIIGFFLS